MHASAIKIVRMMSSLVTAQEVFQSSESWQFSINLCSLIGKGKPWPRQPAELVTTCHHLSSLVITCHDKVVAAIEESHGVFLANWLVQRAVPGLGQRVWTATP